MFDNLFADLHKIICDHPMPRSISDKLLSELRELYETLNPEPSKSEQEVSE